MGIFTVVLELIKAFKKNFVEFEKVLLLFSVICFFLLLEVLFILSYILVNLAFPFLFYISQVTFFRGSCGQFLYFYFFDHFSSVSHCLFLFFLCFVELFEDSFLIDFFISIGDLDVFARWLVLLFSECFFWLLKHWNARDFGLVGIGESLLVPGAGVGLLHADID